jgi:hypothetical protein
LFENCADAKLDRDDFNFDGVWFPEELLLDYEDREFTNDVVFSNCTFNGKVSFRNCVFHQKVKFPTQSSRMRSISTVVNFGRR